MNCKKLLIFFNFKENISSNIKLQFTRCIEFFSTTLQVSDFLRNLSLDKDKMNRCIIKNEIYGLNKANDTESLEYALQVIMNKAEDENGNKLFSEGDRASLRREIPLTVLTDLMLKMQGVEEEVDTVNSKSTS